MYVSRIYLEIARAAATASDATAASATAAAAAAISVGEPIIFYSNIDFCFRLRVSVKFITALKAMKAIKL